MKIIIMVGWDASCVWQAHCALVPHCLLIYLDALMYFYMTKLAGTSSYINKKK